MQQCGDQEGCRVSGDNAATADVIERVDRGSGFTVCGKSVKAAASPLSRGLLELDSAPGGSETALGNLPGEGATVNQGRMTGWVATVTAGVVLAYLTWRPRMLRWGATMQEASERLPGDDLEPAPLTQSTRAITIEAPPERVWPWIVQMGSERAGFYTHEWVERPLGIRYVDGHSATRIHPELQDLKVGDRFAYGGRAMVEVFDVEPGKHLVHAEAFILRPLPGGCTRLIVRYRGNGYLRPAVHAVAPNGPLPVRVLRFVVEHVPGLDLAVRGFDFFVADPLHHYMETGMLKGIKARAEGTPEAS